VRCTHRVAPRYDTYISKEAYINEKRPTQGTNNTYFHRVHRASPNRVRCTHRVAPRYDTYISKEAYINEKRPTKETYNTNFLRVHRVIPIHRVIPNRVRCTHCVSPMYDTNISKEAHINEKRPKKETNKTN